MDLSKIYKYNTREEAIRSKNWAAGSHKQLKDSQYTFGLDGSANYEEIIFAPSFHKIIDEPIVNALDQALKKCNVAKPVKNIQIAFSRQDNSIEIRDDGPGIPIEIQTETNVFIPEFCCAFFDQGSNNGEAKEDGIGGINGLGLKLVNTLSTYFKIDTCDGKKIYTQEWLTGKTVRKEPVIKSAPKSVKPYTSIKFVPDYEFFGYTSVSTELCDLIEKLLITRATMASVYVNKFSKVAIYYNRTEIKVKKLVELAANITKLLEKENIVCNFKHSPTLDIAYIITKTPTNKGAALTNVNGIVVCAGKHIKSMSSTLLKRVDETMRKSTKTKNKFSISYLTKNIIILCNMQLPSPNWTGQRKDYLDSDIGEITIPNSVIKSVVEFTRDTIIENLYGKKTKTATNKIRVDKYKAATFAGTAKSNQCTLFIVEGDSAMAPVYTAIKNNKELGAERYGILCSGGVIINARKETKIVSTSTTEYFQRSEKLTKNIFINSLMQVVGLNYSYKYDPKSPTFESEMKTLRYHYICGALDQDLDGNNIFGLTKNFILLFWPNLIKIGMLKKLETPIVRLYPKKGGQVMEFYHDSEHKKYTSDPNYQADKYDERYYKGLSTNSNEEVIAMFKSCAKHIYTIEYDPAAHETVEIYYGKDTKKRKVELSTPINTTYENLLARRKNMQITCTDYLQNDVKPFQLDNILRKLNSAIDGMNQSGRKIYHGSHKYFAAAGKKDVKAEQLAGFIANREIYHHGDTNLGKSILGKTKLMVGGIQIPHIIATGQSGSRLEGGEDCGEPRYVGVKFNKKCMDLLFPPKDYYMLNFIFDEGRRGEPCHYIPIIPMIVESHSLPGTAWKLQVWGRDVFGVIDVVRECINAGKCENVPEIPFCTRGFLGDIRRLGNSYASFGTYKIVDSKHIIITELPLRVWSNKYEASVLQPMLDGDGGYVEDVKNASDTNTVEIHVKLCDGALDRINAKYGQINGFNIEVIDPIEDFFHLYNIMSETVNLIGYNNEVLELKRYEDVIPIWFPLRQKLYCQRMEREKLMLEMRLLVLTNTIKYLTSSEYVNKCENVESMMAFLREKQYPMLNTAIMHDPGFVKNEDIWKAFIECGTYDYLMDLREKDKTDRHIEKLTGEKMIVENDLENLNKTTWKTLWIKELNQFENVVKEGLKTKWLYDDCGKWKL